MNRFVRLAVVLAFVASAARAADAPAQRIVSAGGAITEIVYALGFADNIVAVDTTSYYPPDAMKKPKVGYLRQLAAEPILALQPTLLLADGDAGPPDVLAQMRDAGLDIVMAPDDPSPEGVLVKIDLVATALGVPEKGAVLAARLQSELSALKARIDTARHRPRVLFLLSIGQGGAPLAAGTDTAAAEIIRMAGGKNVVDSFEGYKPLSPEAMVAAAPDIILATHRSLGLLGGQDTLLAIPEIAATPAGAERRVIAMDGLLLLGFSLRLPQAVRGLANALHPNLKLAD
ncbi:MAG: hemin ABC transporter substrate-binding protein [Alphaproteobacteria bacterium]